MFLALGLGMGVDARVSVVMDVVAVAAVTVEVVRAAMSRCRQGSLLAWQRAWGWVHGSWDDCLELWGGQVSGEASAHSSGL